MRGADVHEQRTKYIVATFCQPSAINLLLWRSALCVGSLPHLQTAADGRLSAPNRRPNSETKNSNPFIGGLFHGHRDGRAFRPKVEN